ncbi:MAG: hypothetical protein FJW24_00925 [Acidimicrobiia bacterium]|nr:hypothetical protein [Acidimicrobiia bacterium]
MNLMGRCHYSAFVGLVFGLTFAWPVAPAAGDFEIIRTALDRVWRLDKRSGKISVCRLDQTQPVCAPAGKEPGAATPAKNRRVVHVVRQPVRPIIVVKPAPHTHGRKWKR